MHGVSIENTLHLFHYKPALFNLRCGPYLRFKGDVIMQPGFNYLYKCVMFFFYVITAVTCHGNTPALPRLDCPLPTNSAKRRKKKMYLWESPALNCQGWKRLIASEKDRLTGLLALGSV